MSILYPDGTPAYGATSVVVALTLADPAAPSILTDLTAGNSLNASCFLYSGGEATSETNKGTAPRRICDVSQREQFGSTLFTIADLQYVYAPQGDAVDEGNGLKEMLAPGLELYILTRDGKPAKVENLVATDLVGVHHIRLGPVQNRTKTGDDEFSEFSITQGAVYIEDPTYDVAIVA